MRIEAEPIDEKAMSAGWRGKSMAENDSAEHR